MRAEAAILLHHHHIEQICLKNCFPVQVSSAWLAMAMSWPSPPNPIDTMRYDSSLAAGAGPLRQAPAIA